MSGLAAANGAKGDMTASTGRPVPVIEPVLFQYSMYSFWNWRFKTLTSEIWVAVNCSLREPYVAAIGAAIGSPESSSAAWTYFVLVGAQ